MTWIRGIVSCRRNLLVPALCLISAAVAGCATTAGMPPAPIRVLAMQTPMEPDAGRLQAVLAPGEKRALPLAEERIAQAVQHAEQRASTTMATALLAQPMLLPVAVPPDAQLLFETIRRRGLDGFITPEEAERLSAATGADALLRFGITDYGLTPRAWRNGYIAFEVTTDLALVWVVAYSGSTAAKTIAALFLVGDAVKTTASLYAGSWALETVLRPVRIQAELVRLRPVATVWKTTDTGRSRWDLSRLSRDVSAEERENQLDQATDDAVHDVVSHLPGVLGRVGMGRR